jgi:hypothetical protein
LFSFSVVSAEMKLPGGERAFVDVNKLQGYCLNAIHPRGRHKARVFASALQMTQRDAEFLREQLLEAALRGNATTGEADEYGRRYKVDFECIRYGRRGTIRSGWIVRRGEDFPRLITCYVISE